MMENEPVTKPEGRAQVFLLDRRFGRFLLLCGTFQIAILCASLLISYRASNIQGIDLGSILQVLLGAAFMAFAQPLSLIVFPYGLTYMTNPYLDSLFPGKLPLFLTFLFLFLPYLVYTGIFVPAILTHKRLVFFILYLVFVMILIINVTGCVVMPKPGAV